MADEKAATMDVMTEYPSRLQMSMLAPVRRMAELIKPGDKEVYICGYVRGTARGVSFRNNQNSTDGTAAEALLGAFEGIPSYEDMEGFTDNEKCAGRARLASAVVFFPPQAQAVIVRAILGDKHDKPTGIKRGQRHDVLGVEVPVALEIGIRKSTGEGGVGYEWVVRGLARVEAVNPIEHMRKLLGTSSAPDMRKLVDQSEKPLAGPAKGAKKPPSKKR